MIQLFQTLIWSVKKKSHHFLFKKGGGRQRERERLGKVLDGRLGGGVGEIIHRTDRGLTQILYESSKPLIGEAQETFSQ